MGFLPGIILSIVNRPIRDIYVSISMSHIHMYTAHFFLVILKDNLGTSLVVQWLRICLPMQGTWVWALLQEDPTCHGATKLMHHNYWACALELTSHNYWARVPQLLKPTCLEPLLRNKRSHHNEKAAYHNEE